MLTVTPRRLRRSTPYLLVFSSAFAAPAIVRAQDATGIVTGNVTDQNLRPLSGALLRVIDGTAEASAGRDGRYNLFKVPTGNRSIVVRYLGYQPETLSVVVSPSNTARADVSLKRPLQQLDAILVESAVAGQAAALNQQRAADNLSNVVDAELVGRLPDRNLAEALGRVPGIALVRDQGEGRFVQIRGTNSALSTLSIDGMRMANPSPASRQTPMDVIPSDMVAAIQVSKTLTPDMEGDAIGGNVNLVTPAPRSGPVQMSINLAGGQNLINKGLLGNASGTVGGRFGPQNKFGVLVGANFYQNDRGSQNYEMGWCVETTCNGVQSANALDVPASLALRDYSQILRRRHGANAALDYQINDRHQLFAKYFWSNFCDDEQRYVTTSNFSSGTYSNVLANTGTVTNGRMDKELRLRPVCQEQQSIQVGGKHVFTTGTDVDYTVQRASALEERPNSLTMVFRQSNVNFSYDVSDQDRPIANALSGAPLDATKFNYNSLRRQTRNVDEDENTGRLNVAQAFHLGSLHGVLKVGGLVRDKDRSSVDSSTRFLTTYKTGQPTPTLPVTIAAVSGTPRTYNFLDNRFVFGPQAGARPVRDFYEAYKNALNVDTAASKFETNQGSYGISERVASGFGMATLDFGRLRLIGGARLENTNQTTTGNNARRAGQVVTVTPTSTTRSYSNVLPSLTARFDIDQLTVLRAAVTRSLVRADFNQMAPTVNIPDGNNVIATIGNTELDPILATNIDIMAERYFRSVGFVSAGYFHKDLTNYIYSVLRPATATDNLGSTVQSVSQPQNSEDGKLDGVELAWQQNFPFLPGPLSGLGLNANYTKTTSSTTLPSREGIKARLPGQAGNSANVGAFYEKSSVALRIGYNFADRYLEVVSDAATNDIYVESRNQLDLSGSMQINPKTKVFFEANNLTNQPLRRYIGKPERSWQPGNEYYKSWGMIGLRIQP
ncbi:MAG: TonB-dependent receptor [Gemmatimonas sp.]